MKTLSLLDYCYRLNAWLFVISKSIPHRYAGNVLKKNDFVGKSLDALLKFFPDAKVNTTFATETDFIKSNRTYAEVKFKKGILLIVFENFICVQVEYFSDRK